MKGHFDTDFGLPGMVGISSRVTRVLRGGPDSLYVAGRFSMTDGVPVRNIARWNGRAWSALGDGLPGIVYALALDATGRLYAGGDFTLNGASETNYIARWDGANWSPIGEVQGGPVRVLQVLADGAVIAGGDFSRLGGVETGPLARFDGTTWTALGTGIDGRVSAIEPTGASGFCFAGLFSTVGAVEAGSAACHDGTRFTALGKGLPGEVTTLLTLPNGDILAGGSLTFILDDTTGEYRAGLARLASGSTTWERYAGGIDNGFLNEVRALALDAEGGLWAGGCFGSAGEGEASVEATNIARYKDGVWQAVGNGLGNSTAVVMPQLVGANTFLLEPDGRMVVGGLFSEADGGAHMNLAVWNGTAFEALVSPTTRFLGLNGFADALAVAPEGGLYVGGMFSFAGATAANNVARFEGDRFVAMGAGLNDVVRVILPLADGTVVAGGEFLGDDKKSMPYLARWHGSAWSAMGKFDAPVFALAEDESGNLYAGGDFSRVGNVAAGKVAMWDRTGWRALGGGFDSRVSSLAVDRQGRLIAGGQFTRAGTLPTPKLARWNGVAWENIGGVETKLEYVSVVRVAPDGALIVGGNFTSIGGIAANGIARFDGTWSALGDGFGSEFEGTPAIVTSVAFFGDGLFAAGIIGHSGKTPLKHLAYWDGVAWHDVGGGMSDIVESLALDGTQLFVGGPFASAAGMPSLGLARWNFATP